MGVGNVVDQAFVDPKGKPFLPSQLGRIKKLKVKWPKLSNGTNVTAPGQTATVDLTLSGQDLDLAGFDGEGINPRVLDTDTKGVARRRIQVALLISGVAYEGSFLVDFKLAKKKNSGTIKTAR